MALFSFRHTVKTFSDKSSADTRQARHGQTAAHLKYITRQQAARVVIRMRLSHQNDDEVAIAAEQEAETRRGRVCERLILALPLEATPEQRETLVRWFCEALTKGTAGYIAAIHDQRGNDIKNPHAHIAAFDLQVKGGGRGRPRSTIGMARKHAIEETAALWAETHNRMMDGWGYDISSHITHLSYAARGIDRIPEIHEGSASRHMSSKGIKPGTKFEWLHIDSGHTRAEANALIREINNLKQENDHEDHAAAFRLGNHDENNRRSCESSGQDERTNSGCLGRDTRSSAPPWAAPGATGRSDDANGNQESNAPFPTDDFQFTKANAPSVSPFTNSNSLPRRSRFRRIFLELIKIRDRLHARLINKASFPTPDIEPNRPQYIPDRSKDDFGRE